MSGEPPIFGARGLESARGLEGSKGLEGVQDPRTRGLEGFESLRRPPVPVSRPWGPVAPEFQETIQIRNPRANSSTATHPWKMFASVESGDCRLHVWHGALTVPTWTNSGDDFYGTNNEGSASIGSGSPISESIPIGHGSAGYLDLPASDTYGIWLMVGSNHSDFATSAVDIGPFGYPGTYARYNISLGAIIKESTTYTELTDASNMGSVTPAAGDKDIAIYLGKVVVDADGVGTITQHRRSDVVLVCPVMWLPRIVSTDADNSISTGTDGGAFYDAP